MLFKHFTNKVLNYFFKISFIFFVNCAFAKDDRMQKISYYSIDLTEVSIGEFNKFTNTKNYITEAEKRGWGYVYSSGWIKKMAGIGKTLWNKRRIK